MDIEWDKLGIGGELKLVPEDLEHLLLPLVIQMNVIPVIGQGEVVIHFFDQGNVIIVAGIDDHLPLIIVAPHLHFPALRVKVEE